MSKELDGYLEYKRQKEDYESRLEAHEKAESKGDAVANHDAVSVGEVLKWFKDEGTKAVSQRPPNMDYFRAMERNRTQLDKLLDIYISQTRKLRQDADFADLGRPFRSQYT